MSDAASDSGYERCGAVRKGKTCKLPAGHGTDHVGIGKCRLHGGSTPTHEKAANMEIARRECLALGIPVETTPAEALLRSVHVAAGDLEFYERLVQQLPIHPEPDRYIEGDAKTNGHWEHGKPGVYGPTYHVSGIPTGEAKRHILVALYEEAQKRVADFAAAALRAGVDERQLRLAEADAQWVTAAQTGALEQMGLGDRIEEFRAKFNATLAASTQPAHLGAASTG